MTADEMRAAIQAGIDAAMADLPQRTAHAVAQALEAAFAKHDLGRGPTATGTRARNGHDRDDKKDIAAIATARHPAQPGTHSPHEQARTAAFNDALKQLGH